MTDTINNIKKLIWQQMSQSGEIEVYANSRLSKENIYSPLILKSNPKWAFLSPLRNFLMELNETYSIRGRSKQRGVVHCLISVFVEVGKATSLKESFKRDVI